MSWAEFDIIAANHPQRAAAFARIRKVIDDAGHNPVLDPETLSHMAQLTSGEVEFVLRKLASGGVLRGVHSRRCPYCGDDLDEEILDEAMGSVGEARCQCGELVPEKPSEVTRYMLANPGVYRPADTLAEQVRIGVITALPKEGAAFRVMLDGRMDLALKGGGSRPRVYDIGTVPALGGGTHAIIHLCLNDMGNNIAATRAAVLLNDFPVINHIIMVGIAGGVPNHENAENHVRLGDIVVSDRHGVVQYDFMKQERDKIVPRHRPAPPAAPLMDAVSRIRVQEEEGARPWCEELALGARLPGYTRPEDASDTLADSRDPTVLVNHPVDPARANGQPRVFHGPIASSGTLLKDSLRRDRLRDDFGVKAVEMEASGIADATWDKGAGFLVVRGICDYCDGFKNDSWQKYAALAAAAYTRALLRNLPPLA
jgi:nucleoside phosphorylase